MTTEQIIKAYKDKENTPCPITNKLVMAGYQQENDGYIEYAAKCGIEIDYTKALPTQYWHLLKSYCDRTPLEKTFGKNIVCGELILWMAEVLECVEENELNELVNEIIKSATPSPKKDKTKPQVKYERTPCNKKIQDLCFDKIKEKVENM